MSDSVAGRSSVSDRLALLLLLKATMALCSIACELLLAQTLSAFFSNTVLRYSVTIGLYMFCMGLGAFAAERRLAVKPWQALFQVEVALTLAGALSVPSLFLLGWLGLPAVALLILAHAFIAAIGFLAGFELPLTLALAALQKDNARNKVIAFDYFGAFLGTLVFVFVLYPLAGLLASVALVALVNSLAAFLLARGWRDEFASESIRCQQMAWFLGLVMVAGLLFAPYFQELCVRMYLH